MRISELSRRSGVPVGTIKYYLRERLLQPGLPTARNQALYDDEHLVRLRVIRTLTGTGQLSLGSVREVLTAIDNKRLSLQGLCHVVNRVMDSDTTLPPDNMATDQVRSLVDDYLTKRLGWQVGVDAPARATLARVLAGLMRLGWNIDVEALTPYAQAAERLAEYELSSMPPDSAGGEAATVFVARIVLFEVALASLRRLAQEDRASRLDSLNA